MTYADFLEAKRRNSCYSGISVNESDINDKLKAFQKFSTKIALSKGRFALFEDCGTAKRYKIFIPIYLNYKNR